MLVLLAEGTVKDRRQAAVGGASGDSRDLAGALRAWGLAGLLQRGRRVPGRGVTFRRKVPLH
ncbi:MAG: hypothetical protein IPK63_16720 [Candidatus Competibacteraceae bacterium]|nr:hypothetical protein [Candidatus Competibacteraceae bacterium]